MSGPVKNQLDGRAKSKGLRAIMSPRIVLALVLISVFSFGALLALTGFADDLRNKDNGRAHAVSDAATGFAGVTELLRGNGFDVALSRKKLNDYYGGEFRVVTLSWPYQIPNREDIRSDRPTLIVLPKWFTLPLKEHPGWVKSNKEPVGPVFKPRFVNKFLDDLLPGLKLAQPSEDDGTLKYDIDSDVGALPSGKDFNIRFLQTLEGGGIISVMNANERIILGMIEGTSIYILSDPDLLNTMGVSTKSRARFGQDLLEGLVTMHSTRPNHVVFDLSVHGYGRSQNLIKTLLTPPFLAATLCLLAAGLLIGWQAFARFGDPVREERDYALGKYTLADNAARFIRIAQKETGMAGGYRDLMRRIVAKVFHMERKSQAEIEQFLAGREDTLDMATRWKTLSAELTNTDDKHTFLLAAQAVYKWRQEITHEHK